MMSEEAEATHSQHVDQQPGPSLGLMLRPPFAVATGGRQQARPGRLLSSTELKRVSPDDHFPRFGKLSGVVHCRVVCRV